MVMKNVIIVLKNSAYPIYRIPFKMLTDVSVGGIEIDTVEILSEDDDLGFTNAIERFKSVADNVIILVGTANFDYKSIIATALSTEIFENDTARSYIEENGFIPSSEYTDMPIDATAIKNPYGQFQGFICEQKSFTLSVLPLEEKEALLMAKDFLFPYIRAKSGETVFEFTFKYFGDNKKIGAFLKSLSEKSDGKMDYFINSVNGDSTIKLVFYGYEQAQKDNEIRLIFDEFKEEIYQDKDVSLSETLFELLKLKNKKIATAESFTAGRVIGEIVKYSGASSYVVEGIVCYSEESKMNRLSVKEEDLKTVGAVSTAVAYTMAKDLLLTDGCDIAVSTTGLAGPNGDGSGVPVGTGYIGIGMRDGIHVYKRHFIGTREEITETAKNTALFLAIKKLKNI